MRTLWRLLAGIFKWTWRVLNFIRQLALNVVFLVLVLACVGIWAQFSSNTTEQTWGHWPSTVWRQLGSPTGKLAV